MSWSSQFTYLPTEVWTQIFATLPAKSLLRFRRVCKSRCSIIDNPDLIGMHFKLCEINSGNNQLLLALEGVGNIGDEDWLLTLRESQTLQTISRIFWISDIYSYQIKSSCNGLLLVLQHGPHGSQLRLWNPWFAPHTQDYKVVKFAFDYSQYADSGNVCRLFDSVPTAVFFRGAVHWLGIIDNQRHAFTHLASFDFDHKKLTFLELPFTCEESGTLRFLFFLWGSLAVFSISEVTSSIWMLDLDNQKRPWTLWFSGKSTQDGYEAFELCSANLEKARIVSLSPEKEAKERMTKVYYCENGGGYLVCGNKAYNIASGQVQPFKRYMSSHLELETYSESLVLSKAYGARDLRSFP
ncbi:F-box/kelch-repeat protein At3g06240-like [Silene latifolia]|uniref:F-box/kelch-repeat protein At3g06240-like n=1 Tax=Silene latifolia TaxID=37657 RepID=UPI003D774DAB